MKFDPKSIETMKENKYIHLTTKGRKTGKPHTVELWFAYADDNVYLSHEGEHTDWMKNIAKDGNVKVKIGTLRFDASAHVDVKGKSRERGMKALYEKYYGKATKEVIDDWFDQSAVVELIPFA